jgi:hypothetical protein
MTKLESVLAPYEVSGELGAKPFDRQYVRAALASASRQTAVAFWLAVLAQMGVFVLAVSFAIANASDPKVLGAVLAGGGGGVGACAFAMLRLWREKVATDLTFALVSSLDEGAALTVLNVVLDTLRGTQDARQDARKARRA